MCSILSLQVKSSRLCMNQTAQQIGKKGLPIAGHAGNASDFAGEEIEGDIRQCAIGDGNIAQ